MKTFARILAFRILTFALLLGLTSGIRITGDGKLAFHSRHAALPAVFPVRALPAIDAQILEE
jgi:hypothetical protein